MFHIIVIYCKTEGCNINYDYGIKFFPISACKHQTSETSDFEETIQVHGAYYDI